MRADLADEARKRARLLQIPGGLYLRVLLRNARRTGAQPPPISDKPRYKRVPVPLVMAKSEREAIARAVAPMGLPEHLERLVAADTAEPKRPLVILP